MRSFQLLFCFVSAIIFIHLGGQVITAQPTSREEYYCEGVYIDSSQYKRNLDLLLSSLPSEVTVGKSFYNKSIGEVPDRVYGILLCRGDVTNDACKVCAESATAEAPKVCPDKKEFISWYEHCMIRYSHRYIFSVMEINVGV
ncbi:Gnk2-homologous domain [Macleaya cordata]|uniref:Gnk2-homologous domain n=1 Tax=Macleaya cordata TaxID=56857 RepID=A0A200QWI2_MACCD|nr:Gnk2-homologous domain [Macleaya cordata]